MSGKTNEKKGAKDKATEKPNNDVADLPTAPVKKKLKPYTKPHIERHYANAAMGSNKPFEISPHKLVEIYHNNAAKETDSEEERNKNKIQVKIKTDIVPHLNIVGHDCGDVKVGPQHIHEESYEEPHAPRNCYTNKSYELPTIASKMKQAVKLDFNMFNFKAIPFCPVSSTTPSHNIGINIQQVMSIIKTRQPVQGISPTLAHNINLAAEKLNHDPLTSFVSSMTSKIGYGRSTCPLNKYSLNYRHLEEIARTLPEEPIEEMDEVVNRTGNAAGPSGDMQMRNPPSPGQWTSDNGRRICTCAPTPGVEFQQVYNKYRSQPSSYDNKAHSSKQPPATAHDIYKKASNDAASRKIKSMGYVDDQNQNMVADMVQENDQVESPLFGKEKNLRNVLMNLHDDFEAMNRRYEDLSNRAVAGDATQETIKELEELEEQLNKKEEEINIVMSLYKEVVTLKQQVRNLKKFGSAMSNTPKRRRSEDYTSKTAQHITKLLQQIHYHRVYHKHGQDGYVM
ncbi:hypothetical protein WA026_013725 [Henosepilachna vigintioctopunctata]